MRRAYDLFLGIRKSGACVGVGWVQERKSRNGIFHWRSETCGCWLVCVYLWMRMLKRCVGRLESKMGLDCGGMG